MANFFHFRRPVQLAVVAALLGTGLSACGSSSSTTKVTATGTYFLTVNFSGTSKKVAITLTDSSGNSNTYTMEDGGAIPDLKGVYTVSAATVDGHTPASQVVDLSSSSKTITLTY